jgi:hypothetical protein
MSSAIIWCVGVYASASTWTFNLVREMALATRPPGGVTPHFCAGAYDIRRLDTPGLHIVKTHEVHDPATAAALGARATRLLITVRDPRDAVASMVAYQKHSFADALAHVQAALTLCVRLAPDPRALIYYYESGVHEQPATAASIAAHLGLSLPAAARDRIFDGLTRGRVEAYIATLPGRPGILQERASGDLLDPATHWHSHHAGRTGESGRWRQVLKPDQATQITRQLAGLYKFGAV